MDTLADGGQVRKTNVDINIMEELRRLLVMVAFGHEKGLEGAAADIETILRRAEAVGDVGSRFKETTRPTAEKLLENLNPETSPVPDIELAHITLRTLAGLTAAQVNSYMELGRLATALRQWVVPLAALPDEDNPGAVKQPGPLKSMPNLVFIRGMDEAVKVKQKLLEDCRREIAKGLKDGRVPAGAGYVHFPAGPPRRIGEPLETLRFDRLGYYCPVHEQRFEFWRADDALDKDTDPRSGCERCALILAMAFKKAPPATGQATK